MEYRLLLLSLAAMLFLAPSSDSALPSACDWHVPRLKCTARVPESTWMNELMGFRDLWLHDIQAPALANLSRVCSQQHQPSSDCRKINTLTLSKYTWTTNESFAIDHVVQFISSLPMLEHLNVSRNDFTSIDWCSKVVAKNLRSFDASHNMLLDVDQDSFQGMSQLIELYLASNSLHELPSALRRLGKLQVLDVSGNRILKLNDVLRNMPELRRLNLAGNKISFVQNDHLQDLRNLVELDISRNAFVFIRAESLQSLSSLSSLNLSENRLIERDLSLLLDSVRRLEVVDASRIGLWRVPATLTRSVKIMRLVGNQLTAVNSGDFDSYPLLKLLDLSGNKLIGIEDDALGRLDDLEELNLYANILSSVPKSLPGQLKILDLRQNRVTTVNVNDLRGLSNLQRLDLSGNVISSIDNGAFRHLTALRELDLSDNPVKKLTADALSGPLAITRLRMAGLTEFKLEENQNQDTAFPYSAPEHVTHLDLSRSSSLAALFLADNATLSACKKLNTLDLSSTNISEIRSDIYYVLTELDLIVLAGNEVNCSKWTDDLVECREHEYIDFRRKRAKELRQEKQTTSTTISIGKIMSSSSSSYENRVKKQFDMLVKPTATPPTSIVVTHSTTTTTTEMPTSEISTKRSAETSTTMQTRTSENTTPSSVSLTNPTSAYLGEERTLLFTQRQAKTSEANVVNMVITTTVEDNQSSQTTTTARPLLTNGYEKVTTRTSSEEDVSSEAPPAVIDLSNDLTTTFYDENLKPAGHIFSEFSRSKVLLANDEEQVSAEELINDRGQRHSELFSNGAHPGMLILVGAVIGAAAALTVVLSKRATAKGREQYHRQENIALTPTSEQRW